MAFDKTIIMSTPFAAYNAGKRMKRADDWQEEFNKQKLVTNDLDIQNRLMANFLTQQTLPASIQAMNSAAGIQSVNAAAAVDNFFTQQSTNRLRRTGAELQNQSLEENRDKVLTTYANAIEANNVEAKRAANPAPIPTVGQVQATAGQPQAFVGQVQAPAGQVQSPPGDRLAAMRNFFGTSNTVQLAPGQYTTVGDMFEYVDRTTGERKRSATPPAGYTYVGK